LRSFVEDAPAPDFYRRLLPEACTRRASSEDLCPRIFTKDLHMITVTKLNGRPMSLNPDLIERIETAPDTHIHLRNDTRYIVLESLEEITERILHYRASVIVLAGQASFAALGNLQAHHEPGTPTLRVVSAPQKKPSPKES